MAGNLFDVFVVGATDPTPAGEARLAAALSAKHGLPVPTIAKAITTKNLRAGQGLEQAQAQQLVRQLQGMGAVTVIRPVAGAKAAPNPVAGTTVPPTPASGPPPATPAVRQTMGPASGDQWAAFGPAPGINPNSNMGPPLGTPGATGNGLNDPFRLPTSAGGRPDPFAAPSPSQAGASPIAPKPAGRPDPFAPPPGGTIVPQIRAATPSPRSVPSAPKGIASPVAPASPKLELARGDRGSGQDESGLIRMTGGSVLRDARPGAASGVAMDEDPRNLNLIRCAQHGLYYDKTKASGCRKCLSTAREVAQGLENRGGGTVRVADLRSSPAKRAFAGLGLALLLGLLPAAYYAFGPGASKVRQLRIEQEILSRQPGTEQILHRFDELEDLVAQSRDSSLRNTAVVWAAVTAAAMFGWYKIT
jgi:hypothetical protein